MPQFLYKAYLANGKIDRDRIEASSREAAYQVLSGSGRMPFFLQPADRSAPGTKTSAGNRFSGTASKPSDARLFSDLSVLLQSGFTIDQAVATHLSDDLAAADRKRLEIIQGRLNEGSTVSRAFAEVGVGEDVAAMISAGENSGHLPDVFAGVSRRFEDSAKRRSDMQEALLYPAFLIVMMMAAVIILAFYLVPAIEPVFDGSEQPKPFIVAALSDFRTFVSQFGIALLAALLAVVVLVIFSQHARQRVLDLRRWLPFVGRFVTQTAISNYLHALHLLLSNGVAVRDAMRLSAASAGSEAIRQRLHLAEEALTSGSSLNAALASTGLLPEGLIAQIRIGEESNNLATMLSRVATAIDTRQKVKLDRLLKFLTPAITILLGLIIGGLVTSVMSTLLSINELAIR